MPVGFQSGGRTKENAHGIVPVIRPITLVEVVPTVAEKRPTAKPRRRAESDSSEPCALEAAEVAVQQAREALRRAQDVYERAKNQATEHLEQARETTVGDVVDGTRRLVRRYPGAGVLVASLLGFFLGRWTRWR